MKSGQERLRRRGDKILFTYPHISFLYLPISSFYTKIRMMNRDLQETFKRLKTSPHPPEKRGISIKIEQKETPK